MSSILKIKELLPDFTTSEKKIAQYILSDRQTVIEQTVQELSKKINVSTATLVRFAHKLGFQGFPDLKLALAKESVNEKDESDLTDELMETDTIADLMRKSYLYRMRALEKVVKLSDFQKIEKAIDRIKCAKRIFLMGVGGSNIVCSDIYHKLMRIGYIVIYTSDTRVQLTSLNSMCKDDVLICVSYSGETKEVVLAGKIAKEKGSCVISITQVVKSSLNKLSDIVCPVPSEEKDFRIGAISSRDTSLFVADLIYMGVLLDNFNASKSKLYETKKILSYL